jgi:dihydroneopterin aldolase/2-amino-4-hydroxy-6-hydroxymethyldihydropteridine diphosphokinase
MTKEAPSTISWTRTYIGVGSNIDPDANILWALRLLAGEMKLTDVSTFYITQPLGAPGSPHFYNGVVAGMTDLGVSGLRHLLLHIETEVGRQRTEDKYAPRPIDLDLLLLDDEVAEGEGWRVPHPDVRVRAFVAVPLLELAPDLILPDSGRPLCDIAEEISPLLGEPLDEFTGRLRALIERHSRPEPGSP